MVLFKPWLNDFNFKSVTVEFFSNQDDPVTNIKLAGGSIDYPESAIKILNADFVKININNCAAEHRAGRTEKLASTIFHKLMIKRHASVKNIF